MYKICCREIEKLRVPTGTALDRIQANAASIVLEAAYRMKNSRQWRVFGMRQICSPTKVTNMHILTL
jgi:hypothetical protein